MIADIIKPRHLRSGATIGIVTPSEPVNDEDFDRAVAFLRNSASIFVLGAIRERGAATWLELTRSERRTL